MEMVFVEITNVFFLSKLIENGNDVYTTIVFTQYRAFM